MTHPRDPEPLRPMLRATQVELAQRLEEACSHDVEEETTAELVRLEETLSEAARVAKQAVSLRRRLRTGHGAVDPVAASEVRGASDEQVRTERRTPQADDRDGPSEHDASVREFLDKTGTTWRVWAVTQEQLHPGPLLADHMGDFRDGWLTFECGDGTERRRLPHYPPNWRKLTNLDLEGLLGQAESVRRRRPTGDDSETSLS